MDTDQLTLGLVLTTAGATAGGGFIAALVQLVKPMLPETWQHGRAVLAIVYALSALLVAGAVIESALALSPGTIFLAVLSWQGVSAIAIGSYEVTLKAARMVSGTTDAEGPDVEGP